jgi:hypothetical protein
MPAINHADEPAWFNDLQPNSLLSTKELTTLFKFKSHTAISTAVIKNNFPKPDKKFKGRMYWNVDTIKKEIKRRTHVHSNQKKLIPISMNDVASINELISRCRVFSDSKEVASGLEDCGDMYDRYYICEARDHINGSWQWMVQAYKVLRHIQSKYEQPPKEEA